MAEEKFNPLFQILEDTFNKSTKDDFENNYLNKIKDVKKWKCYSDYCFDDRNKPNDVVCFTLVPYIHEFEELSSHIKTLASADIKNTKFVRDDFLLFLKSYPLLNFSFIINNRKRILGSNHKDVKLVLKNTFEYIKQQYIDWGKNQPEQRAYYSVIDKKLNCVLQLIKNDKKISQIVSMLLVTFLGAFVSSRILKDVEVEIFGWFSDRDAINEVCDNFSINLFQHFLHGLTDGKDFPFAASPAGSKDNAFYEELVRIPDYIAGAIADYNTKDNLISKDKFNAILTNYMADNTHNNFIYRIFDENNILSCTRITVYKNLEENTLPNIV